MPYGVCPSATTLAALLLGRTRRIRVGTAVSVLPTTHPGDARRAGGAAASDRPAGGSRSGVGRGGPWVDLEVFGTGLEAYEKGFPESLDLLLALAARAAVSARTASASASARWLSYPGRRSSLDGRPRGPEVVVACTSPTSVRLAAERGLPMLLGMHVGDEEKAEMVALWRQRARAAGTSGGRDRERRRTCVGRRRARSPTGATDAVETL